MRRFEGKVALITGAASGIGRATAERLASEGASLFLVDLAKEGLEESVKRCVAKGATAESAPCDVSREEQVNDAVARCLDRFGRLDVLVNNAGVFNPKPFVELTEADYDWYLDTILKGKFFAAQAASKAMKEKGGAIVQTGSMWAIQAIGATPSAAYSAANAGAAITAMAAARYRFFIRLLSRPRLRRCARHRSSRG